MYDEPRRGRSCADPLRTMNETSNKQRRPNSLRLQGFDYSSEATYYLTISTKDKLPIFDNPQKRAIVLNNAYECSKAQSAYILAVAVMTDHIHVLIYNPGKKPISDYVRDFKSITYHQFRSNFGYARSIWQRYYHDHIIRDDRDFQEKFEYVLNNPIKAELTTKEGDPEF